MEKPYLSVVCAVILKNNQVLAVKRSEKQSLPGHWEFPGGKVEFDETEKIAIIREIEEELSITVVPIMTLTPSWWQGETDLIHLVPIVCEWPNGEIVLQEHAEFRWLSTEELPSLNWAPADVSVVKQVAALMEQF
jgi:8-oxo-dGTP diphosphatase